MLKIVTPAASMVILWGLTGCSTSHYKEIQGYPRLGYDDKEEIAALSAYVASQSTNLDALNTVQLRGHYIETRKLLIDLQYNNFLAKITGVKNGMDFSKDVAVGTMGTVGALVGGGTAQILSAASAATTTLGSSASTVYFYNQTLPAIISAMNAGRKTAWATVTQGETNTFEAYPIQRAADDMDTYYYAGTFSGASLSIQKNSSTQSVKADDQSRTNQTEKALMILHGDWGKTEK